MRPLNLASLLLWLICSLPLFANEPYLILISFDGFRWDYPDRGITPNMQLMRENGVSAISMQPVFPSKTFPNHISTITGMYPENHGIIFNNITNPFTGETYRLNNREAVRDSRWYLGEFFWETAERQGITTASYFWPGSAIALKYRKPTYYEEYEHTRPYEQRVHGVLNWLQLPAAERPHFITLYFHETDTQGHQFGPDSPETNQAIKLLDQMLGLLIDGLRKIDMLDQTNIIVTSDHGMTNVDTARIIDVQSLVGDATCKYYETGPAMMVQPLPNDIESVYRTLKTKARHFTVYRREDVPEYFHFSHHPFISSLVLVADLGWSLHTTNSAEFYRNTHTTGGNHGYDNHQMDMHGVFYAMGPAFKKGYRTGTVRNIDIYPLLCKIFNIMPRQNIDGRLDRIEFVLQDKPVRVADNKQKKLNAE